MNSTEYTPKNPPRTKDEIRRYLTRFEAVDWIETLMIAGSIVIFLLVFIFQLVIVDGHSMEPTLQPNQRLFTWSATLSKLKPDDIVCVNREGEKPLIKRVIATEGQVVDIDPQLGKVYVDGEELSEPFILEPTYTDGGDRSIGFPVEVPEDCVFVMGDNRNDSLDSRYAEVGMIPLDHIFGKVVFRVFPFTEIGKIG